MRSSESSYDNGIDKDNPSQNYEITFIIATMKNHSWNTIKESFKGRSSTKISHLISSEDSELLIISSSSDVGVMRNSGRQGSRLGPKALIYELSKLEAPKGFNEKIKVIEVASQELESQDFNTAQVEETNKIKSELGTKATKVVHLGGGHDHIYPLLAAMDSYERILILNIDAHLDTRIDDWAHSGTPFRQFDQNTKNKFTLLQLGVHPETNNSKNYTELDNGEMRPLPFTREEHLNEILKNISETSFDCVVLSIDCDGIDSNDVEAVSAPAHSGTPIYLVEKLIKEVSKMEVPKFMGVYEFNPTFDSISGKSAKKVSWLINKFIF